MGEVVGVLVVWHIVASELVHSPFLPTPVHVLQTFWVLSTTGDMQNQTLWMHAAASLLRVFEGFLAALVTGTMAGLWMGMNERVYNYSKVILEPIRFIPPLAWIPVVIMLMKGEMRFVFVLWIGAFFAILLTTKAGVESIDPTLWEAVRALGATRRQAVWKLAIPGALPHIFSGARLGMGVAWASIVAAEMIGGGFLGLGRLIMNYGEMLRMDAVIVGMATIGLLGYLLNEMFLLTEKRLFKWRDGTTHSEIV